MFTLYHNRILVFLYSIYEVVKKFEDMIIFLLLFRFIWDLFYIQFFFLFIFKKTILLLQSYCQLSIGQTLCLLIAKYLQDLRLSLNFHLPLILSTLLFEIFI